MIDTHCHIDDEQYAGEIDAVIRRQQEAGVQAILVPGVNGRSVESVLELCGQYPGYLYPALGLHPEEVKENWRAELEQIRAAVFSHPLVGIGEIGLDYHWDTTYKHEQQLVFRQQLDWALQLNLPVMVHARDAVEDTFTILREYAQRGLRGVLHCYSGSREMAEKYVALGYKLGIGGVITFKNCKLAEVLCPSDGSKNAIPLEALVLETDAPYMAPVPYRGKPNESRYMEYVVAKLAEAYQVSSQRVIEATNATAKALFGIK
ncbi:MAG: TatD family hydrolase [Paludibacteraceae bacterium]|nr:TatD family hydrolase [Paludibacteraceae bacterium]